jgi:hypothetical protein
MILKFKAGPMSMIFAWNQNTDPTPGADNWSNHGIMNRLPLTVTLI